MYVIESRNVSEALLLGLQALNQYGVDEESRVGPVRVFQCPVSTLYHKPKERVLFYPERDANPFFHFMEGLWMLAGRNDVAWISQFSTNIRNYSDDGKTFHGAYGYRWREHFGFDQLAMVAELLHENPKDRRCSLSMWDPRCDLGAEGKDFPCNQMINPRIVNGALDISVFNRSNDMIWGAYGANAVHFSMMQEVLAAWIGVEVGRYWQISTNFHAYHSVMEKHVELFRMGAGFDQYSIGLVDPYPMVNTDILTWFSELELFMERTPVIGYQDKFFARVAVPMMRAWRLYKEKNYKMAISALSNDCAAQDWSLAGIEWIQRRAK